MRHQTIGRCQDGSRIGGGNSGDRTVARATLLAFSRFRKGFDSLAILNYQFGWLQDEKKESLGCRSVARPYRAGRCRSKAADS